VIERDIDWWRHRVCRTRGKGGIRDAKPFVYAWYQGNKPRGYLIYTFEQADNGLNHRAGTLNVHEICYDSIKSLLAILSFCYNHSSQADRFKLTVPNTDVLYDLFTEPDNITCKLLTGPMVRLVDVTQALSELQYPSIDKNITISVSDEFAEWNNGTFTLNINNGTGSCSRNPNSKADINIDIGALSQLAVGYRSAMELVNSNRMELNSEISVTDISKIFPEKTVFLTHRF
jgi:predicted acetyltransferase